MKRSSNDKEESPSVKLKVQAQKLKGSKISQVFEFVQEQVKVFA